MSHRWIVWAALAMGSIPLVGCASARHVQNFPDGGVVAIPANSNHWPFYYRNKALELIQESAPTGYEIVMEEEATRSVVTETSTRKTTTPAPALVLEGVQVASGDYPGYDEPRLASVSFPLRKEQEDTEELSRETEFKEWRIHYRRK